MISTRLPSLSVALLVGAFLVRPLVAQRYDPLDRAVSAWARVKTVRATFEQTITNPLTGTDLTSRGEYQQRRPGKLSVRFDDPATDRIVADGHFVWLYLPSSAPGQVIRSRLSGQGTGTVDLTAQFLSEPRERFVVSDAGVLQIAGRSAHGYTLVPRAHAGAAFQKALVYVDDHDGTIRQFTVFEANDVRRTVRLTSYHANVSVDPDAFVFVPPPGTRVLEH